MTGLAFLAGRDYHLSNYPQAEKAKWSSTSHWHTPNQGLQEASGLIVHSWGPEMS